MEEKELEDLYDKLYVYTDYLVKQKKWFRKGNSDTFLKGKEVHDYVSEAIEKYLTNPEKYDSSTGRSLLNYLKLHVIRTLVGNDARSPENKTSKDVFAVQEDLDDNESTYLDKVLPFLDAFFPDEIDYHSIMEHVENEIQGDKDVENMFMGLCLYDLKRRDIIKEFSMTEGQYDNGLRRLKTILKNTAQQFNLKSKAS